MSRPDAAAPGGPAPIWTPPWTICGLRRPAVVAIGGLPGTGNSTLARALAPCLGRAPGALVLRSDEIRKRLHGVAPEQQLAADRLRENASLAVCNALVAALAEAAARDGHAVIG